MSRPKYEYLSHKDMDGYYADVCRAMASAQYRPDVIVALGRGGLDFGVKLSNWYDDVELVPVMWQTRDGEHKGQELLRSTLKRFNGKSILIVDDMNDTGKTLLEIEGVVRDTIDPFSVDYAVAIENTESDFESTWCSREIQRSEDTQWFVFPWENWWKN